MEEKPAYTGLKYKTRGNASPQGRPRVYFCCHEADFAVFFTPITDEILEIQTNAAIWYREPEAGEPDREQLFADLSQMQLFVIPVTSRFLYQENFARLVEFQFAIEHHIPVLPLMQESNLEVEFNKRCGDLQYLDKNASRNDPTAISYEEKLKKFLSSILVSDELARQIRGAFDAYIFLSYRKKDRKYAQQIMGLIHSNDFCRDIAIWYDEFLIPGENFNEAIITALKKSGLFALVVTPNLLIEGNYVMTTEYRTARKAGKPVLPIEAVETNHEEMAAHYEGIPAFVGADHPAAIAERLKELLRGIALLENDGDPRHLFFIGLAYLSGVDVEVNHDRALELITRAARMDLPEAYEKLVSMYRTGEGVERNYHTAIRWQEEYVASLRAKAEAESGIESISYLFSALWDLGDYQYEVRDLPAAKESYLQMQDCALRLQELGDSEARRDLSVSYEKLGDLCRAECDLVQARQYYQRSLVLCKALASEVKTVEVYRNMSIFYGKLGNLCKIEGDLSNAKVYYQKDLELSEILATGIQTVEARRHLSISYNELGDLCMAEGDLDGARKYYQRSLELDEALVAETKTPEARRDLSISLDRLGDLYFAERDLTGASQFYQRSLDLRKTLSTETQTLEAYRDLSISYERMGDLCFINKDLSGAKAYYQKSLKLAETLDDESQTVEARRDLSVSCEKLGDLCFADKNFHEAKLLYQRSLELREALVEENILLESYQDLSIIYLKLGDLCKEEKELAGAKKFYQKGLKLLKFLAEKFKTIEIQRILSTNYEDLGDLYLTEGDLAKAMEYYQKSLELREALVAEEKTVQSYDDLALSYYRIGLLPILDIDSRRSYLENCKSISKMLYQCTENERYQEYIAAAQRELDKL